MNANWWFEVVGEDSELCGEEFFVQVKRVPGDNGKAEALLIAEDNFPGEELRCLGWVTDETAEDIGLDTY